MTNFMRSTAKMVGIIVLPLIPLSLITKDPTPMIAWAIAAVWIMGAVWLLPSPYGKGR